MDLKDMSVKKEVKSIEERKARHVFYIGVIFHTEGISILRKIFWLWKLSKCLQCTVSIHLKSEKLALCFQTKTKHSLKATVQILFIWNIIK